MNGEELETLAIMVVVAVVVARRGEMTEEQIALERGNHRREEER